MDAGDARDAGTSDAGLDSGVSDAGLFDGGTERDGGLLSPCMQMGDVLSCAHQTLRLSVPRPIPLERVVHVGVPLGTLANWRYQGRGPTYLRVGRHVRYRAQDVTEWIDHLAHR